MLKYVVEKGASPALNDELMVAILLLGMYEVSHYAVTIWPIFLA